MNNDYQKIKSNYAAQISRNIKKAEKNNLTIDNQISPQTIIRYLFKSNKGKTLRVLKVKRMGYYFIY